MSRETPSLNEMLKLYSKKDLWDRIQEKNQLLNQRNHELAVMKKALKLAVKDWCIVDNPNNPKDVVEKYINLAKGDVERDGRQC